MSDLSETIRELRHELSWSAQKMGRFLGRTRATIYHWENGETQPGRPTQALVEILKREVELRKECQTARETEEWIDRLEGKTIVDLVEHVFERSAINKDPYRDLIRKVNDEGGVIIESTTERAVAYVIPLTQHGLRSLTTQLLQMADENLSAQSRQYSNGLHSNTESAEMQDSR